MKLLGKVALITGAGRGIGRATAILFAKEGAKIVVADIDLKAGEETVNLVRNKDSHAIFVRADVSKANDVDRMVRTTIKEYERLDILFNNAGIELTGRVEDTDENKWDTVIKVNLKGVFLCSKYALPIMARQGGGIIINTASIAGAFGLAQEVAYCGSKGGIIALTKAMAIDNALNNIRVNCICPGPIDTRLTHPRPAVVNKIPMRRLGKPEEVAKVALFLASEDSSFITGQAIFVDGGMTAGYELVEA